MRGSVRKVGNRVRITAQLINAADGFHLCSEVYDRNLDDVFKIQDEVSERIAEVLRLNLTAAEKVQLSAIPTQSIEAYDYYSRGRHLFYQYTRAGHRSAIDMPQGPGAGPELRPGLRRPFRLLCVLSIEAGTKPRPGSIRPRKQRSRLWLSTRPCRKPISPSASIKMKEDWDREEEP